MSRAAPELRGCTTQESDDAEVLGGITERARLVAVMFAERGQNIRIIGARHARAKSALTMTKGTTKSGKKTTKKRAPRADDDDILPEYDFSRAGPNRYAQRYAGGANVVALDPDVAALFPDAEAVNRALRALAGIIQDTARKSAPGRKRPKTARAAPLRPPVCAAREC